MEVDDGGFAWPTSLLRGLLRKSAAARAFEEHEHPRGAGGRFTSAGDQQPTMRPGESVPLAERRTLASLPSYYRQAARTQGMPESYTSSKVKELPVSSYKVQELVDQKPKAVTKQDHLALVGRLKRLVVGLQAPTIARGLEPVRRGKRRGMPLIPEGTSPVTARRAYMHGAMLALHGYGTAVYNFSMDDTLKAELKPLVPFIYYAQRRVQNTMLATEKGRWKPYRQEFGTPFADKRRDKVTGDVRLRVPPRQQLIKAARMGSLAAGLLAKASFRPHVG